ncbi:MAG: hypothetical protein NW224_02540 [Leptolyngbyaceae cyanobacterium bins.302]|nr:hypothetical protein [Leptolyngbyaceae cyanobacterium bins.302]
MSQLLKLLLIAPTVVAPVLSLLMLATPARANSDTWVPVTEGYACKRTITRTPKQLVCRRADADNTTGQVVDLTKAQSVVVDEEGAPDGSLPLSFDFTDEESDASVALFGCDCPTCIRSLRQLRNLMS